MGYWASLGDSALTLQCYRGWGVNSSSSKPLGYMETHSDSGFCGFLAVAPVTTTFSIVTKIIQASIKSTSL